MYEIKRKSLYNYIPKFAKMIGETIEIPVEEKNRGKMILQ